MVIEQVKISELKPAEYNPRKLTKDQFEHIKTSLEKFDVVEPVVVNKHPGRENVIVGGHMRCKVLKKMGHKTVPVVYVDLPEKEERELNIRLNKNTGEWDWDLLANQFDVNELLDCGFNVGECGIDFDDNEPVETENKKYKNSMAPDVMECPNCGEEIHMGIRFKKGRK